MSEECEDLALEGWAHAEALEDGTELIVVRLKLHPAALMARDIAIGEGLTRHTRFSPVLGAPSTKVEGK